MYGVLQVTWYDDSGKRRCNLLRSSPGPSSDILAAAPMQGYPTLATACYNGEVGGVAVAENVAAVLVSLVFTACSVFMLRNSTGLLMHTIWLARDKHPSIYQHRSDSCSTPNCVGIHTGIPAGVVVEPGEWCSTAQAAATRACQQASQ
jgi:hypothetical protein